MTKGKSTLYQELPFSLFHSWNEWKYGTEDPQTVVWTFLLWEWNSLSTPKKKANNILLILLLSLFFFFSELHPVHQWCKKHASRFQGAAQPLRRDISSQPPSSASAPHPSVYPNSASVGAVMRQERSGRRGQRGNEYLLEAILDSLQRLEQTVAHLKLEFDVRIQRLEGRESRDSPSKCHLFLNSIVPLMEKMSLCERLYFQNGVNGLVTKIPSPSPIYCTTNISSYPACTHTTFYTRTIHYTHTTISCKHSTTTTPNTYPSSS